jgi:hypothetical protein
MKSLHFFLVIVFLFTVAGCAHKIEEVKPVLVDQLAPEEKIGVEQVPTKLQVGEELHFSIRWLGLEVGRAQLRVEGIEPIRNRDTYHVSVYVESNKIIDLVYKVRDEHHSYIDVEHFHSLQYEKILREGRYRADEIMEYDQAAHTATYLSRRSGSKKQMLIPKDVQDQISAAYWLRAQAMKPGDTIFIPVNADEKNWKLEIRVLRSTQTEIGDLGTFDSLEIDPRAQFQGMFVRRGKFTGWMSMDEKRLPLLMKTAIPVLGSIHIVLVEVNGW